MEIRRAKKEDLEGVGKLLRQVLEVHHKGRPDIFNGGVKKYTDEETLRIFENEKTPVFVAVEDDAVLGYAFCIDQQITDIHILTDIRTLYIDDLCVDETIRGKGIGKALYDFVVAYAKKEGYYNLTLNVWACNESALRFYEKMGLMPQKIGMEKIL